MAGPGPASSLLLQSKYAVPARAPRASSSSAIHGVNSVKTIMTSRFASPSICGRCVTGFKISPIVTDAWTKESSADGIGSLGEIFSGRSGRNGRNGRKKCLQIRFAGGFGVRIGARRGAAVAPVCLASILTEEVAESKDEAALVESLLGIGGRGRGITSTQLQDVQDKVTALEASAGVQDPTSSPLIEGRWQLMFTTRPGTASPIQRTFVGVDKFKVFQEIFLSNTDDPRVTNIVRFSNTIGELRVEAAATKENSTRVLFRFDKAAFNFKFLPFKVPYPVPFRLLGDEAKGWLDTTYLSPTGTFRISRGNKGTTFVLQKNLGPRQQLLEAISSGIDVQKAIDQVVAINPSKSPTDFDGLEGTWRLLWSSQAANANWIQRISSGFSTWQIYSGNERLKNLVQFLPGLRLSAEAQTKVESSERQAVQIEGAQLELGPFRIPAKITGEGYLDVIYLDNKLKISRGNKGSLFVHIRDTASK